MPLLNHEHNFTSTNEGYQCEHCTARVSNTDMAEHRGADHGAFGGRTPDDVWQELHPTKLVEVTTMVEAPVEVGSWPHFWASPSLMPEPPVSESNPNHYTWDED